MNDGPILVLEREGPIAILWLDAPPKNLLSPRFFDLFDRLTRDTLPTLGVEGLIVIGRGRHFSSGADLRELAGALGRGSNVERMLRRNDDATLRIEALPYPTVAAIAGCCLGAGLELSLACRNRIAATSAVFALPEATYGLMPGWGGTVRLPALIGRGQAMELILTGRTVAADEARCLGLVDAVVDKKDLLAAAKRLLAAGGGPSPTESA